MKDFGSCDQRTGECLKCLNNTSGKNCEACKHWHYGDPIVLKNCQQCDCDQCGSESCHAETGACTCKPKVNGYTCDSCGSRMWGFNQCQGCNECECDPQGSTSAQCDTVTGACPCKPGVGGKKCDQCLPDHWNFTTSGCQNCHCEKAGVIVTNTGGFSCNSTTGYCSCIQGVKGKKCDECDERWVLVKHQGCRKCDTCVDTLLDDVELLILKVHGIESGNENSSLTYKAHNKLTLLENEFARLKATKESTALTQIPLLSLQNSIEHIQSIQLPQLKEAISFPIKDKIEPLKSLLAESEEFNRNIALLRNEFDGLESLIKLLENRDEDADSSDAVEGLDLYKQILQEIINRDFTISSSFKDSLEQFELCKSFD